MDRQTETERNIKAERQRDLKSNSRKPEINKQKIKTEQQRSIKLKVESQQRKINKAKMLAHRKGQEN